MKIDVKLSLDAIFVENYGTPNQSSNVASGWVELENAIKFPVKVLQTKKNMAFVKYPQIYRDEKWNNVLFPVEKEAKTEIDTAVLDELRMQLFKQFNVPDINGVRVTLLPDTEQTGKISVKGLATINICGCVINGLTIKEGTNGLFVQMPQYKDSATGKYHDYVYGTNTYVQAAMSAAVLDAYEKEVELAQKQEIEKEATKGMYEQKELKHSAPSK